MQGLDIPKDTTVFCNLWWVHHDPKHWKNPYSFQPGWYSNQMFNAVHGLSPHYISELITPYTPTRSLRSSSQLLLQVPPHRTKTYGKRTFAFSAPALWNSLTATLHSQINLDLFKSHLKTNLFTQSFL